MAIIMHEITATRVVNRHSPNRSGVDISRRPTEELHWTLNYKHAIIIIWMRYIYLRFIISRREASLCILREPNWWSNNQKWYRFNSSCICVQCVILSASEQNVFRPVFGDLNPFPTYETVNNISNIWWVREPYSMT